MDRTENRNGRWFWAAVAVVAMMFVAGGCSRETQTAAKAKAPLVRTAPVRQETITHTVEVTGNILQNRKAAITTTVPGTLKRVYKREGDQVKEGEKLAELDTADFDLAVEQARAGLRAARAGSAASKAVMANMEVQYRRFQELHQRKAVAQAEFDNIETGYKAALEGYKASVAQVGLAEVGLKTALKKRSDTIAFAPLDGFVTQRFMDPGEQVTVMPPAIVMVVMDIDPVKAEGQVAEREAPGIHVGDFVDVLVDSLPGRRFEGKVEAVVPFVDPATRTVRIRVRIPNTDLVLKPGMAATIRISAAKVKALVVPREAMGSLSAGTGKADVFVLRDGDLVAKQTVTVDESRQGEDVVVLDGLRAGERVVTAGLDHIKDGMLVRVDAGPETGRAGK